MILLRHSELADRHAFLSPSNYHWTNYEDEKLDRVFLTAMAARRGTELHAFAHEAIRLGIKLPRSQKTLNMYINDAIGYRMTSEQILYYSENCFGTADTLSFKSNILRIHDLKTGKIPASVRQHEVYAALFCLEYRMKPFDIQMEFRIYQNDEVQVFDGDPDTIIHIMEKIIAFDRRIELLKAEVL